MQSIILQTFIFKKTYYFSNRINHDTPNAYVTNIDKLCVVSVHELFFDKNV